MNTLTELYDIKFSIIESCKGTDNDFEKLVFLGLA